MLEIFYKGLNAKEKAIVEIITSFEILDKIIKTNWGWHTLEVDVPTSPYMIGASMEQRMVDNFVTQVYIIGSQGKAHIHDESNFVEKAKYLDDQEMVF